MSAVVTQADRDAAAAICRAQRLVTGREAEAIRAGEWDSWAYVQAFAAHREAHTAGLREALEAIVRQTHDRRDHASRAVNALAFAALAEHGK